MTIIRDRIRFIRTKIKELVAEQKADKALLRQPHVSNCDSAPNAPLLQYDVFSRALLITVFHILDREIRGLSPAHKADNWRFAKRYTDAMALVMESVPDAATA